MATFNASTKIDMINPQADLFDTTSLQAIARDQSKFETKGTDGFKVWTNDSFLATPIYVTGDFQMSGNTLTGGTIQGIQAAPLEGISAAYSIGGLDVSLSSLINALNQSTQLGLATLLGGDDTVNGSAESDVLAGFDGNDTVDGFGGDDTLLGGSGMDTLNGGAGLDTIYGGVGFDTLNGGGGKDTLYGEDNNDVLSGGGGADKLFGGPGSDSLSAATVSTGSTAATARTSSDTPRRRSRWWSSSTAQLGRTSRSTARSSTRS